MTLTTKVSATDGTTPAGTVLFEVGATDISLPVALSGGTATTTTTFAAAGTEVVSAVFVPTNFAYAASTGTLSVMVYPPAGNVSIAVTVPQTGTLTVTVAAGVVNLTEQGTGVPQTSTGTLPGVTVTDSRNYSPGWSVSGQESAFSGSGNATVSGDQLGWVPVAVDALVGGASLGPVVNPGTSPGGLGDSAGVLAYADVGSGVGTNVLSALLTLDIPASTPAGAYGGQLFITYLEAGP